MARELIPLSKIDPNPWQPRTAYKPERVESIGCSIGKDDILQPPVARPHPTKPGRYQLAFGHTRNKSFQWLAKLKPKQFAELELVDRYEGYSSMPLEIHDLSDEAMYRHAVAENLQRDDLDAIEEAQAMKRAMDDFSYNSAQVGELFGKNEATVRGMIRLLDLPAEAQALLSAGRISQNAARLILSMQRIAPDNAIAAVIDTIGKNERNDPGETIERTLQQLPGVITLWHSYNQGKPRGKYNDAWLLDMKNFPNKHLPALQRNDLVSALDIHDNRIKAQIGDTPDDEAAVETLLQKWQLSDVEEDRNLAGKLSLLIDPPTCTSCPFYTQIRGEHFCGVRFCFERKTIAWHLDALLSASRQLGIAIYADGDKDYQVLEAWGPPEHVKLFEERHADLRLIPRAMVNRYYGAQSQIYKGVKESIFLVVLTGKKLAELKKIKSQQRAAERAGQKTIHSRWDMFNEKRGELMWDAAASFAQLLAPLSFAALDALRRASYNLARPSGHTGPENDAPEEIKAEWLRHAIGLDILEEFVSWNNDYLSETAVRILNAATKCGVTMPDDFADTARRMDAEINERFPKEAKATTQEDDDDQDDAAEDEEPTEEELAEEA